MKNDELIANKNNFFLQLSSTGRLILAVCFGIGLASFAAGMVMGEQTRTWGSLLFNLMFFFSLALGGVAFGNMQDIVGATWGRPIKRIHEGFAASIPWTSALFIVYLLAIKFDILGAKQIYPWVADPDLLVHFHGKYTWLQLDFMIIRDIVAVLLMAGLAHWNLKLTQRRDEALLKGNTAESEALGEQAKNSLRYWSAPILVIYAFAFSLIAFDLTMSLAPTWFSTLWGGWSFAILMQTLMALTLIMMFHLKKTAMGAFLGRQQFHDIGKLMFGFTVFFAYLTYSHILTYWYGNVPEETSYFITRLKAPWIYMLIASLFMSFLFPFFAMIPKANKWTAGIAIPVAVVILFAQWMNYLLVVIPEIITLEGAWYFPWIEFGVFFGFVGMFFASFYRFGSRVPMLAVADPLLHASLVDDH